MATVKQVIVIRKDLNMRKGKMVAQGSHASLSVFLDLFKQSGCDQGNMVALQLTHEMVQWIESGQTKICVSVDSEQELLDVFQNAKANGLTCSLIRDHGHTEFNGVATLTAVAIGPNYSNEIDKITGKLSLL